MDTTKAQFQTKQKFTFGFRSSNKERKSPDLIGCLLKEWGASSKNGVHPQRMRCILREWGASSESGVDPHH